MSKGNFKVRCINTVGNPDIYTAGRVYEFKDGKMVDDRGVKFPLQKIDNYGEWVSFTSSEFELVKDNQTITIYPKGLETIALLKEDKKIIKSASAKCNPTDVYDFEVGAKLAFSRLMGDEVAIIEYLPSIREVKRPAKVGEWIKIVNDDMCSSNEYKNGDIMQVVGYSGDAGKDNGAYYRDERRKYANHDEYIVLENYQPEEATNPSLSIYTDKELVDELAKRWEDKQ